MIVIQWTPNLGTLGAEPSSVNKDKRYFYRSPNGSFVTQI